MARACQAGKELVWAWNVDQGYDVNFKIDVTPKSGKEVRVCQPVCGMQQNNDVCTAQATTVKNVARGVISKGSWRATEPCTILVT
jgi:hypothetical protein